MATLHVKSSATGGGDGSSGNPYTLQEAFDNVAAGDEIIVWDDATYSEGTQIDVDTTSGTSTNPIKVTGANASGVVDGTKPLIQAASGFTGSFLFSFTLDLYHFQHLTLDANGNCDHCLEFTSAALNNVCREVEITGASSHGLEFQGANNVFIKCELHGNASRGVFGTGSACRFIGCSIHDNLARGLWMQGIDDSEFADCLVYDNGSDGLRIDLSGSNNVSVVGCNFFGNGVSGLDLENGPSGITIFNCTSSENGKYGFEVGTAGVFMDHNHTYNNTSGATDLAGGMPGDNNQTGDPLFANTTDGSEDFTPQDGSPLKQAGIAAASNIETDIGAARSADASGGGGGAIVNQGLHAIETGVTA